MHLYLILSSIRPLESFSKGEIIVVIIVGALATVHAWRSEDNGVELILSFYLCMASGDLIHVAKLAQQLSLLPEPSLLAWRAFTKCWEQLGCSNLFFQLEIYEI